MAREKRSCLGGENERESSRPRNPGLLATLSLQSLDTHLHPPGPPGCPTQLHEHWLFPSPSKDFVVRNYPSVPGLPGCSLLETSEK